MLLVVTGGIGCGKSSYAEELAVSLGREAIRLACPVWPRDRGIPHTDETTGETGSAHTLHTRHGFQWTSLPADEKLAERLTFINSNSNPFRAESRVVLVDSLSGWLRLLLMDGEEGLPSLESDGRSIVAARIEEAEAAWESVLQAIVTFQGIRIVVTEEAHAGLAAHPLERAYVRMLAEGNRRLTEDCHALYRVSFGLAAPIRGEPIKRRNT